MKSTPFSSHHSMTSGRCRSVWTIPADRMDSDRRLGIPDPWCRPDRGRGQSRRRSRGANDPHRRSERLLCGRAGVTRKGERGQSRSAASTNTGVCIIWASSQRLRIRCARSWRIGRLARRIAPTRWSGPSRNSHMRAGPFSPRFGIRFAQETAQPVKYPSGPAAQKCKSTRAPRHVFTSPGARGFHEAFGPLSRTGLIRLPPPCTRAPDLQHLEYTWNRTSE
jgi:hypothetical protein